MADLVSRERMLELYDDVFSGEEDIPGDIVDIVAPEILSRVKAGNEALFQELADSLPKTFAVLCQNYGRAMLGRKRIMDDSIVGIVLPGESWYCHGSVNHSSEFVVEKHDKYYEMLPREIRSYYFAAESWQFVENNRLPFVWDGLPRAKYARPEFGNHLKKVSRRGANVPQIAKKKRVFVWITSASGQVLLVDEETQTLYSWTAGSDQEAEVVDDPVGFWDAHCARVFQSGDTKAPIFDGS